MAYRNRQEPSFPQLDALAKKPLGERIAEALKLRDEVGEFLRAYLIPVLKYADYLKQEISHSVQDFDRVMMWGFAWEMGPFKMIDEIGPENLGMDSQKFYVDDTIRSFDGIYVHPKTESDYAKVTDFEVIGTGEGYNLRDLGDGVTGSVLLLSLESSTPIRSGLCTPCSRAECMAECVTSEARSLAGFDLKFLYQAAMEERYDMIDLALMELQRFGGLLGQIPSVAAVYGYCFGAGLELAVSCSVVAAQAETQIGFPEARVGLIPGGRGTALMRLYNQLSAKKLSDVACHLASGFSAPQRRSSETHRLSSARCHCLSPRPFADGGQEAGFGSPDNPDGGLEAARGTTRRHDRPSLLDR